MSPDLIEIVDCHAHFLDAQVHTYPIFEQRSPGFEVLVGDYSSLPRRYLPEDYSKDTTGFAVKTVWAEFMSADAGKEARWAENLSGAAGQPHGIIAVVDFLSPNIEKALDSYSSLRHVRAVRQHLAWHPTNPLLRFAERPDVLTDKCWQQRLRLLRKYNFCCEIEIMAPQLADFSGVASSFPDIQFILPVMGWPLDTTETGRQAWKSGMKALSSCENVAVKIFGMECIFGVHWTIAQIRPWILDTIDLFTPKRSMFASHMPIAGLASTFQDLYRAYFDVVSAFSASEKRNLFHDTATIVYGLAGSTSACL
ncbi:MAG: amidohydrolase family protein [Bryobacteraceae bacterium]